MDDRIQCQSHHGFSQSSPLFYTPYNLAGYVSRQHIESTVDLRAKLDFKGDKVALLQNAYIERLTILQRVEQLWMKYPKRYRKCFEDRVQIPSNYVLARCCASVRNSLTSGISKQKWDTWRTPPKLSLSTTQGIRPSSILWKPSEIALDDKSKEFWQLVAKENASIWENLPPQPPILEHPTLVPQAHKPNSSRNRTFIIHKKIIQELASETQDEISMGGSSFEPNKQIRFKPPTQQETQDKISMSGSSFKSPPQQETQDEISMSGSSFKSPPQQETQDEISMSGSSFESPPQQETQDEISMSGSSFESPPQQETQDKNSKCYECLENQAHCNATPENACDRCERRRLGCTFHGKVLKPSAGQSKDTKCGNCLKYRLICDATIDKPCTRCVNKHYMCIFHGKLLRGRILQNKDSKCDYCKKKHRRCNVTIDKPCALCVKDRSACIFRGKLLRGQPQQTKDSKCDACLKRGFSCDATTDKPCKWCVKNNSTCIMHGKHLQDSTYQIQNKDAKCDSCLKNIRKCNATADTPCDSCVKWKNICIFHGKLLRGHKRKFEAIDD